MNEWLTAQGVPAITGIDTRALTKTLRAHGTMRGWLFPSDLDLAEAQRHCATVDMRSEVFHDVSPKDPIYYPGGNQTILLIDIGAKDNIVRSLLARGASVIRAPWHAEILQLSKQADGILIGNGPGDPKNLGQLIEQLSVLLDSYRKPIFGICLGNQLLTLAAGGDTYKLPYGHRGVNPLTLTKTDPGMLKITVLLHFEWVELPPNSHYREGRESLDSPRPPRPVAAHYTDYPYSEKQMAISESLKGYVAPKAHIHSAGVSPVSVRIYNEIGAAISMARRIPGLAAGLRVDSPWTSP